VSPVRYKLGFYIPEGVILHSHCREDPKSYEQDEIMELTLKMDSAFG
jgi:hypothetical protein